MSERGSGLGPFLLGIVLGAVAGVLFAPARGDVTRQRLGRRVGELRELADEKIEELANLDEEEEEEEEPTARDELEGRLREARRRRRIERATRSRNRAPEEEDEPVA